MILPNFPKNCMKLKEFGPPRGVSLTPPFDPPMYFVPYIYGDTTITSWVLSNFYQFFFTKISMVLSMKDLKI